MVALKDRQCESSSEEYPGSTSGRSATTTLGDRDGFLLVKGAGSITIVYDDGMSSKIEARLDAQAAEGILRSLADEEFPIMSNDGSTFLYRRSWGCEIAISPFTLLAPAPLAELRPERFRSTALKHEQFVQFVEDLARLAGREPIRIPVGNSRRKNESILVP